ncbi:unnamed protein product [Clonostachys chloroleuca]|uniref:Uncharacterized protein n=1 Tax=Clonostachys chloroleuca TaxID=1926264 RepID=A0AA35Q607_9HYPO|nr:unnamed protein product [Clonostachys chloroleuca]
MLFSAFLAASAATLVVASYEESDDIALRSLTDIEERDELLGGLESLNSRSFSVQARSTIAREAMMALVDTKVATLGMYHQEARGTTMAREVMMALVDTKVATLGMYHQEARGTTMAKEVMSFRDCKA